MFLNLKIHGVPYTKYQPDKMYVTLKLHELKLTVYSHFILQYSLFMLTPLSYINLLGYDFQTVERRQGTVFSITFNNTTQIQSRNIGACKWNTWCKG
jgi:hypothetical protein